MEPILIIPPKNPDSPAETWEEAVLQKTKEYMTGRYLSMRPPREDQVYTYTDYSKGGEGETLCFNVSGVWRHVLRLGLSGRLMTVAFELDDLTTMMRHYTDGRGTPIKNKAWLRRLVSRGVPPNASPPRGGYVDWGHVLSSHFNPDVICPGIGVYLSESRFTHIDGTHRMARAWLEGLPAWWFWMADIRELDEGRHYLRLKPSTVNLWRQMEETHGEAALALAMAYNGEGLGFIEEMQEAERNGLR